MILSKSACSAVVAWTLISVALADDQEVSRTPAAVVDALDELERIEGFRAVRGKDGKVLGAVLEKTTVEQRAVNLLAHLHGLESISMIECNVSEEIDWSSLDRIGSLRRRRFKRVTFGKPPNLRALSRVERLNLLGSRGIDRLMSEVTAMQGFRYLVLDQTDISPKGFEQLRGARITMLSIDFTDLGDEGLEVIVSMPDIRSVYCVGVNFSEEARDRVKYSREDPIDFQY